MRKAKILILVLLLTNIITLFCMVEMARRHADYDASVNAGLECLVDFNMPAKNDKRRLEEYSRQLDLFNMRHPGYWLMEKYAKKVKEKEKRKEDGKEKRTQLD